MSTQITHILRLTDALTAHQGITHWAVSLRLTGKGDFIDRLKKGGDCRTRTAEAVLQGFSNMWPDTSLEWPEDIPRPVPGAAQETRRRA